jgi:O-antigen/teichoic acid export membrane protein
LVARNKSKRARQRARRNSDDLAPRVERQEADIPSAPAPASQSVASQVRARRSARLPDYGDDDWSGSTLVLDAEGEQHNGHRSSGVGVAERDASLRYEQVVEPLPYAVEEALELLPDQGAAPVATEKQTAMRGLFGRDMAYLLVVASQSAVAALSIPITTRLLGRQFAVWTTSLAVMQVLLAIGVFSLPTAVQRNYAAEDGGRKARKTITLAFFTSAITLVISYSTGPLWAPALGLGNFGAPLQYAVVWAMFCAVTFAAMALLRSRDKFRAYALVSLIQSLVADAASVLLVAFVHRSAATFLLGEMGVQGLALAIALYATRPLPLRRRDAALIRSSLKYSSGLVPAAVSGFLLMASDRIVLHHDLPADHYLQVARYGAVYNIAAIPILLLGLLDSVWLPRFFGVKDPELRAALLADSRDVLLRLLIPTVVGLGLGVPMVLSVWVPDYYHPAGLVIVVVTISVGAFPMVGYLSANRVLLIAGRTVPLGMCFVIAAAFNIAANIILVPIWGIEGSALATSAAYLLLLGLGVALSHRIQRLRRPSARLLLASAVAIAVALGCAVVPATGVLAVIRAILALACIAVVVASLRDVMSDRSGRRALARVSSEVRG